LGYDRIKLGMMLIRVSLILRTVDLLLQNSNGCMLQFLSLLGPISVPGKAGRQAGVSRTRPCCCCRAAVCVLLGGGDVSDTLPAAAWGVMHHAQLHPAAAPCRLSIN
jgi:hypothetical protein